MNTIPHIFLTLIFLVTFARCDLGGQKRPYCNATIYMIDSLNRSVPNVTMQIGGAGLRSDVKTDQNGIAFVPSLYGPIMVTPFKCGGYRWCVFDPPFGSMCYSPGLSNATYVATGIPSKIRRTTSI